MNGTRLCISKADALLRNPVGWHIAVESATGGDAGQLVESREICSCLACGPGSLAYALVQLCIRKADALLRDLSYCSGISYRWQRRYALLFSMRVLYQQQQMCMSRTAHVAGC